MTNERKRTKNSILEFKLILLDRDERTEIAAAHRSLVSFCLLLAHVVIISCLSLSALVSLFVHVVVVS